MHRLGHEQLAPLVRANLGSMVVAEDGRVAGADQSATVDRRELVDPSFAAAGEVELPPFVD